MTPPSRLRVLMTTDAVGGVWSYTSELARALCQRGAHVLLVVMGPAPRPDLLLPLLSIEGLQIKIADLELEWLDPQARDFEHARCTLLQLFEQFRPDIVHLNSFREAVFDWPVPVLVVAHSCVTTWWRACRDGYPDEPRWETYVRNVAAGLASADVWVAPTAAFRNEISATYQAPTSGRVIRNGVSLEATQAIAAKEQFVLGAGRLWDEAKNLKSLTRIAGNLPWPLRVAGPRQGPDGLCAASLDSVWLGQLSHRDLLTEMSRAAIFVAPALYEPFGLTVLEAAARGCALVIADLPSFREIWGDAAVFVDPHDPATISAALHRLCRDKRLRAQLQTAASARAKLYSLSAMAMAYRQLYGEMITARSTAADSNISVRELRA